MIKKALFCIFVCMLLINIAISVVGNEEKFSERNNDLTLQTTVTTSPLETDKWMKTYGGFRNDAGSNVLLTSDGGYIIAGITRSFGEGKEDVWLIKTDATGNMSWNTTFGGPDADFGNFIQQTNDDGYIFIGSTKSYGNGEDDIWLVKTDASGNKLWDKTFGYDLYDSASEVRQTSDGGYVIVGMKNSDGGGDSDLWVIKTDPNGNLVWDRTFDGDGHPISHDYGNSIVVTSDDCYLVLGATFTSEDTNDYDLWLIKIDADGTMIWEKKIGGEDTEYGWSVQQTTDNGYIITGTDSYSGSSDKLWLIKTDGSGTLVWDETYTGEGSARGSCVQQTSDGGYIVAGYTWAESYYDVLLLKTDDDGIQQWSQTFGGKYTDIAMSVKQTPDGGYILTGYKGDLFHTLDVWLIKTDENGESQLTTSHEKYFYPMVKIGWDMNTTNCELMETGLLAKYLSGPGNTNGVEWGFGTPLGNINILLGCKIKVTEGAVILSPMGRKLVTLNPGDTIQWVLCCSVVPAYNFDPNNTMFSGRAFGVIVEKA